MITLTSDVPLSVRSATVHPLRKEPEIVAGRHTRQPASASLFGPLATAVVVLALLVSGAFGALKLTEEKSASTVGRIEVPQSTTDAPSAETPSPTVAATPAATPKPKATPTRSPEHASRGSVRPPSSKKPSPEKTTTSKPAAGGTVVDSGTCGASYYDEGQTTANGEAFDPEALTAAHKTLRLQHACTGDEPRQRQVGGGPDQRPRSVRLRALHRPVPSGVPRDRQPQPGRVDRQVRHSRQLTADRKGVAMRQHRDPEDPSKTDRVGQNRIGRGANFVQSRHVDQACCSRVPMLFSPPGRRPLSPGSRAGLGAAFVLLAIVSAVELADGSSANYVGLIAAVPFLAAVFASWRMVLVVGVLATVVGIAVRHGRHAA